MKKRGKRGRGRPRKKTPKPKFSTKVSRAVKKENKKAKRKSYRSEEQRKPMFLAVDECKLKIPLISAVNAKMLKNKKNALVREVARKYGVKPKSVRSRLNNEAKTLRPGDEMSGCAGQCRQSICFNFLSFSLTHALFLLQLGKLFITP